MGMHANYKTPSEMQKAIDKYLKNCPDKRTVFFKLKDDVIEREVPRLTISGLCYSLGFASRQSFYDYEKKGKFAYTIKRARLFIEKEYEMQLDAGNPTGAIFALKNFGWKDKQEIKHDGSMVSININKKESDVWFLNA